MASTKVPSVLWNVAQSLDKDDKALARTNIGVNTLIGSADSHKFVTGIAADGTTGDLSLTTGRPTVSDLSDLAFDDANGVSPYNSSTNKVATVSSVTKRIGDLDGNLNNTQPGSGKTLTAFSQTDGVVSATFGNISITESQISDFGTYSTDSFKTVSDGTNTITASGTTDTLNVTGTSPVNVTANASTKTVTVSVPAATPSSSGTGGSAGLMSATDKEKLDTLLSYSAVSDSNGHTVTASGTNQTLTLKSGGDVTISADSSANRVTISYSHPTNGANVSKGDTTNQTPGFGDTFKVTSGTVNSLGHTTTFADHTVQIPNTLASPSSGGTGGSAGLMSAADKEKLDTLSSIATVGTDLMLNNGVISVDTTGDIDAASNSGNNFVMGSVTHVKKSTSSDLPCKCCFIGGSQSNMIGAEDSFLFGNQSTIGALANDARPDGCIVLGNSINVYGGGNNVAIGASITIDGTISPAYSYPNYFTLIGHNLSVDKSTMPANAMLDGCLILGKYNSETTNGSAIRVTGWGAGPGQTNSNINVEELYSDGSLWTKSGFYIKNVTQDSGRTSTRMARICWESGQNVMQTLRIEHASSKSTEHQSYASPYEITSQYFQTNDAEPDIPINIRQVSMLIHDYNNQGGVGTGEALIEFKSNMSSYDTSGTGFVQIPNALPAYSFDSSAIATSRVRLYGGRTTQPACDLTSHGAPMGNLVLGTVSLNFYNASDLTSSHPLRPSEQKGEISIVYADAYTASGTKIDNKFYVQDNGGIHEQGGYIQSGQFMLLLTVEPTIYTSTYTVQSIGQFAYLLPRAL